MCYIIFPLVWNYIGGITNEMCLSMKELMLFFFRRVSLVNQEPAIFTDRTI